MYSNCVNYEMVFHKHHHKHQLLHLQHQELRSKIAIHLVYLVVGYYLWILFYFCCKNQIYFFIDKRFIVAHHLFLFVFWKSVDKFIPSSPLYLLSFVFLAIFQQSFSSIYELNYVITIFTFKSLLNSLSGWFMTYVYHISSKCVL